MLPVNAMRAQFTDAFAGAPIALGNGRAKPSRLVIDTFRARTDDGWVLQLQRTFSPAHFDSSLCPMLLVPGYGMNSFIFGYHPRGTSMTRSLAERGFEVWTVNLRKQSGTYATHASSAEPSLETYALDDLPAAVRTVLETTHAHPAEVLLVGCSMGGTLCYGYLAHEKNAPVRGLVTMGTPLRWDAAHPLVRIAFGSPKLASLVRIKGTRDVVRQVLPVLSRVPKLLSAYVNVNHVDVSQAHELVQTVEDPHPRINEALARWITDRDLTLRGKNLTHAVGDLRHPLLVIAANADGIVPERAVLSVLDAWGGKDVETLRVGNERTRFAHADLFVANSVPEHVFSPLATWAVARSR